MKRIEELYAFITIDDDGDEGIIAFLDEQNNTWIPMVGADGERVESMIPLADSMGVEYEIRYFAPKQDS